MRRGNWSGDLGQGVCRRRASAPPLLNRPGRIIVNGQLPAMGSQSALTPGERITRNSTRRFSARSPQCAVPVFLGHFCGCPGVAALIGRDAP